MDTRVIAFYLPQYHPIPENDAWWGKGFTEWTNVAQAKRLFRGHYQPHIPADLGFYDLRLSETRSAQAQLAREYGIEGFCYWHYWFEGKRLLERPFNEVLTSGEPDFPFCLAWANETWSRRWLGEEKDILQKQTYSLQDDANHIRWLLRAFADRRYLRVQGRPLFLVYRPNDFLDPRRTTDLWRDECVRSGVADPFLIGINAHCPFVDCRTLGFDATLNFEPQLGVLPEPWTDRPTIGKLKRNREFGVSSPTLKLYDYANARQLMIDRREWMAREGQDFPTIPSIFVGWDNTPRRRRNSIVVLNSTPKRFEQGLAQLVNDPKAGSCGERLIFINAWNEWAEGNHLEPDLKYGHGHLEAVRRAMSASNVNDSAPEIVSSAPRRAIRSVLRCARAMLSRTQ
jgi:lipopolysaccharide biosynthesis protein